MTMTNQEVGCYIKLLCVNWKQGSIPSDINKIAKLCGEDSSAMAQLWPSLKTCFVGNGIDGRLVNPRIEKEREKQRKYRQERSASGKKGAEIRWKNKQNGSAMQQPLAKNSSSSSSSSSNKKKNTKKKNKTQIPDNYSLEKIHIEYAESKGLSQKTIQDEFEGFCIHHRKVGSKFVDWYAAWQTWVRNHIKFKTKDERETDDAFARVRAKLQARGESV